MSSEYSGSITIKAFRIPPGHPQDTLTSPKLADNTTYICYDCHGVAIDTEFLNCLCASIDETKPHFLPSGELENARWRVAYTWCRITSFFLCTIKVVSPVNEIVVRGWNLGMSVEQISC